MSYILSLDAGTTSVRAIVFNHDGQVLSVAQKEIRQIFPQPGWVEHDPAGNLVFADECGRGSPGPRPHPAQGRRRHRHHQPARDDHRLGPRHGRCRFTTPSSGRTGGRRAAATSCVRAGAAKIIQQRTGLVVDAYFSATKLQWILDHVPGARKKAAAGELAFGTVDSWLIWKLTSGQQIHVTDASNASRTHALQHPHRRVGSRAAANCFGIPREHAAGGALFQRSLWRSHHLARLAAIPIAGIAGDQQAALFGQMCIAPGLVKNTYGTGCFMLHEHRRETHRVKKPPAHHRRLEAWQQNGIRAGRQHLHRRRGGAMAARRPANWSARRRR